MAQDMSHLKKSKPRKKPQAPGQFLGFSLQENRFLSRLLEAKTGYTVSLEVFGDVGVESKEGSLTTEEAKSLTDDGNPISDRAIGLWKTLSNWIEAVECGDLELENTIFEIYISKPKTGNIVESFSNARSFEEAKHSFLEARKILWGEEPDFKLRSRVSTSIEQYVSKVFNTNDEIICKIIRNFYFNCGSGCALEDLKELMKNKAVPFEIIDKALAYSQGWIKSKITPLLEGKKPAIVVVDDYILELTKFVRKYDRRTILANFANEPGEEQIDREIKLRTYVRQLEIIDCEYDEKITAVRDFLQASVNRTEWSVRGLVMKSSFDEFEENLIRTWGNHRKITEIELSGRDDINKGKYLCARCLLHNARVEGLEIPNHFVPGSFHALAENKIIGWHPNYKKKLEE